MIANARQEAALQILRASGLRCAAYGDNSIVFRHPVKGLVVVNLDLGPFHGL